jgi:hypothetical protein
MTDDFDRLALLEKLKAENAELVADTRRRREAMRQQHDVERREREHAEPREEQASTDTEAAAANADRWNQWADQRIRAVLVERERVLLDAVGQALGESLADERKAIDLEVKTKLLELKIDVLTKVEATLAAMRKVVPEPDVADLPPLPRRTSVN